MARALCLLAAALALGCSDTASSVADATDSEGLDGAPGSACFTEPTHTGEATYYAADGTGNCSFAARADRMVAALNTSDYAGAGLCGACIAVSGPDGAVTVRVVDRCPGCALGDVDLSAEAFAMIANPAAGRVAITWELTTCPGSAPIDLHFKDGSNAFWTAVQAREQRYALTRLEASSPTRDWHDVERLDYNYFVDSDGLGDGPYEFRLHSINGDLLELSGVVGGDDVLVATGQQFPVCE